MLGPLLPPENHPVQLPRQATLGPIFMEFKWALQGPALSQQLWPLIGGEGGQPLKQVELTGQQLGWLQAVVCWNPSLILEKPTQLLVIKGAKGWSHCFSTNSMHTPNSKECPTNSF